LHAFVITECNNVVPEAIKRITWSHISMMLTSSRRDPRTRSLLQRDFRWLVQRILVFLIVVKTDMSAKFWIPCQSRAPK